MTRILHAFVAILLIGKISCLNSVWKYECVEGFCQKRQITNETEDNILSLAECRLVCSNFSGLWPYPTGTSSVSRELVVVNPEKIQTNDLRITNGVSGLTLKAFDIFKDNILKPIQGPARKLISGAEINVLLAVRDQDTTQLTLDTDESYTLRVETIDGKVSVNISANTFFGSRHALETLGQLIVLDDLRDEFKMPKTVLIEDKPAYPHRGILLDTARNYISVDTIKRTINGMGASKMNAFHWHITDSHSFPYQSKSLPDLSKYGAYTPKKVYTADDVADIVEFARTRGVKVIPEFDAPAHVGEGWQNTDFVVCFNKQPWLDYCVEPPCGQFDPTKPKLYDALEAIYGDMLEQFQPDVFHMGGDEVHFGCWNSTDHIVQWMAQNNLGRTEEDFIKLWDSFQMQALERLYKKSGKEIPVVMWTSTITKKEYLKHLPNDKYIIQIWTLGNDPQVTNLLENNYRIILSNYDALYFDCGFAAWVQGGNNWCSPYIGWQKVYENTPYKIAGDKKHLVLGSEATLWTEQADDPSIDTRLWPRAAALAEQLWSEPTTGWRDAESRFLVHRERLVARGVGADAIEPEWCRQYEENCPIGGKFVGPTQH